MGTWRKNLYYVILSDHLFKAKKVRFWVILHDFAKFTIFAVKTTFCRKKMISGEISHIWARNQFFRVWDSKKAPRTLRLSLLLRGSPQGPVFGPNERLWGPKPQNGWNFTILGQNGVVPLYQSWCLFKMSSISLGILDVLTCRKS